MKTLFTAFFFLTLFSSHSQSDSPLSKDFLLNTNFKIDRLLGLDSSLELYHITLAVDTPRFDYGNRLGFNDSLFFSGYAAPCGNDYFTDVMGSYRIVDGNILELCVKQVSYHGEWDPPKPTEYPKEKWLRFQIILLEDVYEFRRI